MAFAFTQDQLSTLTTLQAEAEAGSTPWSTVYDQILSYITTTETNPASGETSVVLLPGVDEAVAIWVTGAEQVNADQGPFAEYIRQYTALQYSIRNPSAPPLPDGQIQAASNTIADRFVGDILNTHLLPDLDQTGRIDAAPAAALIFGGNFSPWAGTVLFTNLGDGTFFNDWVLQLGINDHKQEPGTYDLATIAQASDGLRQPGSAQFELAGAVTLIQLHSIGNGTVTTEEHATNNFFAGTYGVELGSFDIGYDIFSLYPVLFGGRPIIGDYFKYTATYISGQIADDSGLAAIDGQEFVQAGRGDDTIIGAYDIGAKTHTLSVIDGGDGNDTMDYSALSAPISVNFDDVGALGLRVVADKGSDADVHTDDLYQIEHVTLGSAADIVHVPASGVTGTIDIDGSANPDGQPDTLDFSQLDTQLDVSNFNLGSSTFSNGDFTLNFSNFEKVIGTSSDDAFAISDGLAGNLEIDGGAQSSDTGDVLDFSNYSGDLSTLDLTNGILSGTGFTLKFENIEKIVGTANDDEILIPENATVVQVDGGHGDDDITGGAAHAALLGGDGDDFLTAGSGGAVLDGGISATASGDEYVGGPGADIFVIGNGAHGEQGLDSAITIENPGAEDQLVLRLDVTKGFDSDANWTSGIVLNGGIYTDDTDPNFIQAEYSPIAVEPIIGTNSDGAFVSGSTLNFLAPDLGDFVVLYDWQKDTNTLDIKIVAKFGDFDVRVDGFENGDLGLNFTQATAPLAGWFRGSGSDVVIQNSWDTYTAALSGIVSSTQTISLPSPGDPIAGDAAPWTPTAPGADPFFEVANFLPLSEADIDGDHFNPNNGDPAGSSLVSAASPLSDRTLASNVALTPDAAAPNTNGTGSATDVRVAPFAQSHPYALQNEHALVLDLDGNGLGLASINTTTAYVDYEGTGFASHTGWVSPTDGVLVNFDGSDRVTANTILGAVSGNAFADLQALDSNSDGRIDSTDTAAANLRIWTDLDGNGSIGAGEVFTLAEAGVQSIGIQSTASTDVINGNAVAQIGTFATTQSATNTVADVAFAVDKVVTEFLPPDGFAPSEGALALSNLVGYGNVPDLQSAMSQDSALQDQVLQLVLQSPSMSGSQFDSSFETMVQNWAGVSSIDPGADGPLIDARHLALVEAFYGSTFDELYGAGATLDANTAADAEARYHAIVDELKVRFAADAPVIAYTNGVALDSIESSPFLPFALIRFDSVSDTIFADINQIVSALVSLAPADDAAKQSYFDLAGHIIDGLQVDLFNNDAAQLAGAVQGAADQANLAQNWIALLVGGLQENQIDGTTADDVLIGTTDSDIIHGFSGDDVIRGGAGEDVLVGAAGNDILNGGVGADAMAGGAGNDAYFVDNAGDTVTEAADSGVDTVGSSIDFTLAANVEKLTGLGTTGLTLTGNALDNTITGTPGNDVLSGGAGNDTYFVDNAGDVVTEGINSGIDTVRSSVDFTLGANVEKLIGQGSIGLTLNGNELDNTITGTSANDVLNGGDGNDLLNGGTGADAMDGGTGNDNYFVDNVGDTVFEGGGSGIDTVRSSVDFTLGANVETLIGLGTVGLTLTGNELDNTVTGTVGNEAINGGDGNDLLNGSVGADSMAGGSGNDTYFVDNIGDTVTENPNAGIDTVHSSVDFTLGANLEKLVGLGTVGLTLTGNELNNTITGNAGNDMLSGGDGNDRLSGGTGNDIITGGNGNDVLTGGADADVFVFHASFGRDTITDFAAGTGEVIEFHDGVFASAADVLTHATETAGNTVITFDTENSITLQHVALASLSQDDFRVV